MLAWLCILCALSLVSSGSHCRWTEHDGGLSFNTLNVPSGFLNEAREECAARKECTGVTFAPTDDKPSYYMRDGKTLTAGPSSGVVSYLKHCDDNNNATDVVDLEPERHLSSHSFIELLKKYRNSTKNEVPFPRPITIPEKKGNGIIYVLYWKETKSGCTWQGLAQICATQDNQVHGFEFMPGLTTAQMCEASCCAKRGEDKEKGKENCAMFQFKEGIGCYHGKTKKDCQSWKPATDDSSRGWFGGEVNTAAMEHQLRTTRESRFEEMLKSVRSIRAVMPPATSAPYGISIVSPSHYAAALEDDKLEKLKELDIGIQSVDIPDSMEPDFHSSWFFRTVALPSSPFEKTLQLDSDTILCKSLDEQQLWKLLDRYDYAATHAPTLFHDSPRAGEAMARAMVQYNDAVIAYRWNPHTREALARAMESAIALPAYGLRDQAAYREAVWKTETLHDYGLPPVWQCRVPRREPQGVTCNNHAALTQSVMLKLKSDSSNTVPSNSFVHDSKTQCVILHGHTVKQA